MMVEEAAPEMTAGVEMTAMQPMQSSLGGTREASGAQQGTAAQEASQRGTQETSAASAPSAEGGSQEQVIDINTTEEPAAESDTEPEDQQQQERDLGPHDIDMTQGQHNILVAEQMIKSQIFACLYCAPIVLAIAVVLGSEWDRHCDAYLQLWLLGVGILQVIRLPLRVILVRKLMYYVNHQAEEDHFQTCLDDMKRSMAHIILSFLNFLSLAWYLLGIVETMRSNDCEAKAPDTFKLSLALVIIFLVFLGFSCMCRLLYICLVCFHHAMLPPVPQQYQGFFMPNSGASEEVLKEIPTFTYSQSDDGNPITSSNNTCAVCLADFVEGDKVAALPCRHYFHHDEILQWLKDKRTCPLCNTEVTLQSLREDRQAQSTPTEETKTQNELVQESPVPGDVEDHDAQDEVDHVEIVEAQTPPHTGEADDRAA